MVKMTFTLDDETAAALKRTAERTSKPQSAVVREAIAEYAAHVGRLTDAERRAMLKAFDELVPRIPKRPARTADQELRAIRLARRAGGRRSGA
jgi:predicted transcriptional regulator